jgi:hypothetical protein
MSNLDNFNNLINLANQAISCGPSCQNEKQAQQLQQMYLTAQANVASAPQQLTTATKDYITYTQGESGYNNYIDTELQKQANSIVDAFQKNFNDNVNKIITNLNSYNGVVINFDNIFDLYTKYKMDNNKLEASQKTTYSDTLTNDRKSYYEDEGLKKLKNYYYFFLFIYIFVIVVFILSIFLVNTNVKFMTRIFILILLILYPFVCYWIVHFLYMIWKYFASYFTPFHVSNHEDHAQKQEQQQEPQESVQ